MRRIDLTDYKVEVPNQEEQYNLKDGRGPFGSIQDCLDALGVEKAGRPGWKNFNDLPQPLQANIVPLDTVMIPYQTKYSIIELLFARDLNISGVDLLERDDLANKIRGSNGEVLLEEAEWGKLNDACTLLTHFSKPDVEMVRRIMKAEKVEVEEKKSTEEGDQT